MNKRSLRRLLYILMVFVLIFSFAACGEGNKDKDDDGNEGNHGGLIWDDDNNDGKEDDGKDAAVTINVSKNIDFSSVVQDGDYTNFNVVLNKFIHNGRNKIFPFMIVADFIKELFKAFFQYIENIKFKTPHIHRNNAV